MKRIQIVLVLMLIISLCVGILPVFAFTSVDALKIQVDPNNVQAITFTNEEIKQLPKQLQKYLDMRKGKIVGFKVQLFIFEKTDKSTEPKLFKVKTFDFSKKDHINAYAKEIAYVEKLNNENKFKDEVTANEALIQPLVTYSYIAAGLNVDSFSHPSYNVAYQLHGWWEWSTDAIGTFRALYDTMGLLWTAPLYNDSATNNAYANSILNPSSSFSPVVKKRYANSGVLWEHTADYLSEGACLAQIFYGTYQGTPFEIQFEYNDNEGSTSASGWTTNIANYIWNYFGMPGPGGSTKYQSGVITKYF